MLQNDLKGVQFFLSLFFFFKEIVTHNSKNSKIAKIVYLNMKLGKTQYKYKSFLQHLVCQPC
jgi:hypothetical protein